MVWHCKTIRMANNIHMHGGEGEATSFPVLITLPRSDMQQPEEKSVANSLYFQRRPCGVYDFQYDNTLFLISILCFGENFPLSLYHDRDQESYLK